jgi:hypothetical protein
VTQPQERLYLLYHELRPSRSDYSYVVETETFERHVDLFLELRKRKGPGLLPEVTFDDGHISNCEFALPILQSHAIQAWFFITVGWTGQKPGYMDWQQLRALHEAGQQIGAHGWTHTLLTHCSPAELQKELVDARLTLEDKLGTSITTMSLPGGRANRRVLTACHEAGYTQVFTSIPKAEPQPAGPTVGRLNIRGDMTLEWIERLFQPDSGVLSSLERQHQMKATAKTLLGDRLYEKLWAIFNRQEPEIDAGEAAAREDSAHHQ